MEPLKELLTDEEACKIDLALFTLHSLLDKLEGHKEIQPFVIEAILPNLLDAFTNEETSQSSRCRVLRLFHKAVRMVAWADGVDNELVAQSLSETF